MTYTAIPNPITLRQEDLYESFEVEQARLRLFYRFFSRQSIGNLYTFIDSDLGSRVRSPSYEYPILGNHMNREHEVIEIDDPESYGLEDRDVIFRSDLMQFEDVGAYCIYDGLLYLLGYCSLMTLHNYL